ncbi:MAG TPA: phosphate ABC transporter substrate-binding protein [Pirellulales bacterium]|nr:phosphate ABC transporter substrate-binding protein [Pirellulales bacterium]
MTHRSAHLRPFQALLLGLAASVVGLGWSRPAPPARGASTRAASLDPALPRYVPVDGVSGTIKSVGSDSMNNLMTFWTQGFREFYPNVQVEVEGKGSSTAPPALIAGTANFGPMSREMKNKEIDAFEAQYGYKPVALKTAIDMLAVYVHKDNPVAGLTLAQLDAIFSKNRKQGFAHDIRNWGQLGLRGKWAGLSISLYGRNSASGTYGYFKEHALANGDYKDTVKQLAGSATVVQSIARNPGGIGYSGIGYLTADVRAVALADEEGEDFVTPDAVNGYSGEYPLSRYLYVYVNYEPGGELDPLRREFVRYIFSREGQQEVIKDGYLPVKSKAAAATLKLLGIEPRTNARSRQEKRP